MPKSEEERKKASERMKAYHAAKKEAKEAPSMPEYDLKSLQARVEELQSQLERLAANPTVPPISPQPANPQVSRGSLVGTYEKYIIDPAYYPDPRPRLFKEPRLQRFAFETNYEMGWEVSSTAYETIDKIRVREPKFTLELIGVMFDDEGEPTNKRYLIKSAIFHEDPEAALVVAREKGLPVDESNERKFLDEMRFMRMRDWLIEIFYKPKNNAPKKNRREMAIGGKLVQTWEISSEGSESIPFAELKNKL